MSPSLLTDEAAETIVDVCREVAGERLRSVTYFSSTDYHQLYLRDDLEQDADLASFVGLESRESTITEDAYRGTELGEHVYTLRRFENGYLLRVETPSRGVFVTTDDISLSGFEELGSELDQRLESLDG